MPFDERTRIVIGDDGAARLAAASVCVYGLGGVGAAAAMDLVRVGVGRVVVVDFDAVQESNLNRLYFGYVDCVGQPKTRAFAEAARRVNPAVVVEEIGRLVRGREAADAIPDDCAFHLDCIDSLNPKVNLMAALLSRGLPFASSMGTAGRIEPERLRLGSLWDSAGCPLAQRVRQRLKRLGFGPPLNHADRHTEWLARIRGEAPAGPPVLRIAIPCVWSDEPPAPPAPPPDGARVGDVVNGNRVRAVQGSAPFVPQAAGHMLASVAARVILGRA